MQKHPKKNETLIHPPKIITQWLMSAKRKITKNPCHCQPPMARGSAWPLQGQPSQGHHSLSSWRRSVTAPHNRTPPKPLHQSATFSGSGHRGSTFADPPEATKRFGEKFDLNLDELRNESSAWEKWYPDSTQNITRTPRSKQLKLF